MIKMARMAEPDELNWIQNSLAGNKEAYAVLVKQYQKMVLALAFRMTGSLVPCTAVWASVDQKTTRTAVI
jgi:hypothetical protein